MEKVKQNSFKLIGTVGGVNMERKIRKTDGKAYISGNAEINATIDGKECSYEVSFYANEMTTDNKPSQLYKTYSELDQFIGKKVEINGSIRENRFFSPKGGNMVSAQVLDGRFVKGVSSNTADEATWELGGFVTSTLVEKKNKDEEIYRYDLMIAQSNYKEDNISVFTVHGEPEKTNIIKGLNTYQAGDTVILRGVMLFTVTTEEVQVSEGGFGEPIVKTYTNRQKNWYVTGGSQPVQTEAAYTNTEITDFISAYKSRDVQLTEEAANKTTTSSFVEDAPVSAVSKPTTRQTSLI